MKRVTNASSARRDQGTASLAPWSIASAIVLDALARVLASGISVRRVSVGALSVLAVFIGTGAWAGSEGAGRARAA